MYASTLFLVIFLSLSLCANINPRCDFQQDLALGQEYFIYNQEYPNLYRASTSCRWSARSQANTLIVLSCTDLEMPSTPNCYYDKLSVSLSGNENFNDAYNFCGNFTFTLLSQRNTLTVGLFSGSQSPGGKFLCSLSAVKVAPQTCSCSRRFVEGETKIVGGVETKVHEFPWMAVLIDSTNGEAYCGANIISHRYAVTAAHCLLHQNTKTLGLMVGDHDLSTGKETNLNFLYRISHFLQHPSYNSGDETNDIGIVRTQDRMTFNEGVQPVCLPFLYGFSKFENEIVTALGWGFKDFSGNKSDTLQKVHLSVIYNSNCARALSENIKPTQMCTYAPGKDSCLSDSGGPLLWKSQRSRFYYLVGLISYGRGCATMFPAVNTRITSFLSWIVSVTSEHSYCLK